LLTNNKTNVVKHAISSAPSSFEVVGDWKLTLKGYRFPEFAKTLRHLESWTSDEKTKYFSGTGVYEIVFSCPASYIQAEMDTVLDLGKVGSIAEVILNEKAIGTTWMQPYILDTSGVLRPGNNYLRILITNELINYVAGLKAAPDVPNWLQRHYGHGVGSPDTPYLTREFGYRPLPMSGLVGPVRFIAKRRVRLT
jgi:hypothetical protein